MKNLIISIYDDGWGGYSAAEVDENFNTTKIKITHEQVIWFDHWQSSEGPMPFENEYDHIIVCNNGDVERVK